MSARAERVGGVGSGGETGAPAATGTAPSVVHPNTAPITTPNTNTNTSSSNGGIGFECVDPNQEERAGKVREVGSQAIWSLSSCKPGFGVDQLRDDCMDTYWQSDGQLPHLVNIQFRRKTTVKDICIFSDYKLDESYTPSRISIRAGTNFNDLQEVEVIDINEPTGWVMIPVKDLQDRSIRTFMIQIAVISNHQNGRDTHMRQIKIHSPILHKPMAIQPFGNFVTVACQQYSCIR